MKISKMHGLGNSFVLVDHRTPFLNDPAATARTVCDLHFGLGADGLILLERSSSLDLRMRIFNADGSEPEMCGNGVRCFSRFALESGVSASKKLRVETLAGEIDTEILPDGRV
ncbi:MAG: diaminopimelate epimerase, partial [Spirochaetes bacterium]|nr:diaminopimelate epimerase [Spirochaetota bacterium]